MQNSVETGTAENPAFPYPGQGYSISVPRHPDEQPERALRMEAVRMLAGGIAHDFNNILTPVLLRSEIALSELEPESEAARNLEQIRLAARRACDLVRLILDCSRQGRHEPIPLGLGEIVNNEITFLRATIPSTIEITVRVETADDTVQADPARISQALAHLVENAIRAVPKKFGSIRVVVGDDPVRPGFLRLTVQDNGAGISPEDLPRIFDPYFSTWRKGDGSGMGLAVALGIVERHGGTILAESRLGRGSLFTVLLPKSGARR